MQDSTCIYHMTLKSHFTSNFALKRHDFAIRKRDFFIDLNAKRYDVICIVNPLVGAWLYYTLRRDFI